MLASFLSFLKPKETKMARPIKSTIKTAIVIVKFFSIPIIEILKRPCKMVAIIIPVRINFIFLFGSKIERAKKYPKVPEHKACKKVAPIKRKALMAAVCLKRNGSLPGNKTKRFSRAANPKAAIII